MFAANPLLITSVISHDSFNRKRKVINTSFSFFFTLIYPKLSPGLKDFIYLSPLRLLIDIFRVMDAVISHVFYVRESTD